MAMAPHINFWIVACGINIGLNTRMYFADAMEANAADPVLNLIELEVRRNTPLARRETRDGKVVYRFDIRLQGDNETSSSTSESQRCGSDSRTIMEPQR